MASDIAVIGLGVMGRNLALNIADKGYEVAVFNRNSSITHQFIETIESHQKFTAYEELEELCKNLKETKVILLMVAAGQAVDSVIASLLPHLQAGDVIIDAGNSFYRDTERRYRELKNKDIHFLGVGVSGGEEGARHGPSIMPGGSKEAWPLVEDIFMSIAAKADDGEPCCVWVGEGGAGHYVKMVHNGIEYGDMQLIAEAYQLMDKGLNVDEKHLAETFEQWNQGVLSSYLIEITAEILKVKDPDGQLRIKNILDQAGQKGTGLWTAVDSLQLGIPLTLITEAVFARALSARKAERIKAADLLAKHTIQFKGDSDLAIQDIENALYAAKIMSYAQGFMQMKEAAAEYSWHLNYAEIAKLWRAGCIIRSRFLNNITEAFSADEELSHLLFDHFFIEAISTADKAWRNTVTLGIHLGIPLPAMSSGLSFYDGFRSKVLPANMLQAQRDYFGAHTYKRIDCDGDDNFHTQWTSDQSEQKV